MARKRIFEYAKENGLNSKDLVELLRKNGFAVKSHMSVLTPQMEAVLVVRTLDMASVEEEERLLAEEGEREERERLRREEELRRRARERLEEEARKRREEEERREAEERRRLEEEKRKKEEEEERRKAEEEKRHRIEKLIETPEIKKIKEAVPVEPVEGRPAAKAEPPPTPQITEPVVIEGEVEKKGKKKKKKKKAEPIELPGKGKKSAAQKKRRRRAIIEIDEEDLQRTVRKTVARIELGAKRSVKKKYKKKEREEKEEVRNVIVLPGSVTVRELSRKSGVPVNEILGRCLELGIIATINQKLDVDTVELVAESFGFEIKWATPEEMVMPKEEEEEGELVPRPPVVTIMGHVDHGKTSILDFIRKSSVAAGEAGAITQHIGAYQADTPHGKITFIDTPGHEAFTAMRARGAQVTDIVVLVVAQNDGVQSQTIESINHAKAAGVPIVVAINKMDLPGANADRVISELAKHGVLLEEIGGDVLAARVSAKTGEGIDELLENIILQAEMLNLRANPKKAARGVVVESRLDRGLGPVATVLVKDGTLRKGDAFVSGTTYGKVRLLLSENKKPVKEAGPATPVVVTGFAGLAEAGDDFFVTPSEKRAKEISLAREEARKGTIATRRGISLEEMLKSIKSGEVEQFNIILKVDTDGSAKTLSDFISSKEVEGVRVEILHAGVGNITESDILLAEASGAVVFGFNVKMEPSAREAAKRAGVDVRIYKVIYDLEEDLELALSGKLKPKLVEKKLGVAEVRQVFSISKQGKVAGCFVLDGLVRRGAKARVRRVDKIVGEGEISSLKRFKNDVKEVPVGYECGLIISGFDDFQQNDLIEVYQLVEEAAKTG